MTFRRVLIKSSVDLWFIGEGAKAMEEVYCEKLLEDIKGMAPKSELDFCDIQSTRLNWAETREISDMNISFTCHAWLRTLNHRVWGASSEVEKQFFWLPFAVLGRRKNCSTTEILFIEIFVMVMERSLNGDHRVLIRCLFSSLARCNEIQMIIGDETPFGYQIRFHKAASRATLLMWEMQRETR